MHVLILGGTTEASDLARHLASDAYIHATLSLAGRTRNPVLQPIPVRTGGFGGVTGLSAYLRNHAIDALVDATHPFAAQITRNALAAASATGTPTVAILRPEWIAREGDRWQEVATMAEAVAALGSERRRVLLTVGQQELAPFMAAPQHHYVIRSVDPPATVPPGAVCLTARGPFLLEDELRLLETHRIEVVVTKNAGGTATQAKLAACRARGVPMIVVARPALPDGLHHVPDVTAALAWLADHAALRGE